MKVVYVLSDKSWRTTPPPLSLVVPFVSEIFRALGRYCEVVQPTQLADIASDDAAGEDSLAICKLFVMSSPMPSSISPYRVL